MNCSPRRRILMTTDAVGGIWVHATTLARALCRRGHSVTLVVMGPPPTSDQLRPLRNISRLEIEVPRLALEWMDPDGTDLAGASDRLLRIAHRVRPDLVHLNGYRDATFEWSLPVLVVAHSCVWSWWQACHGGNPHGPRWRDYFAGVASGLNAADAWVAPTAAFRDAVAAIYRPRTPGRVIWNGADIRTTSGPRLPFVLTAGRLWDSAKNVDALIDIAPDLDWPVRLAGPLHQDGAQAELLAPGIEHLGTLSRTALAALMRRAGIFVSPSRYEPFGLAVLEAAGAGCALVLADIPTFRELWFEAAVFVDPRDAADLRRAVQSLIRSPALRSRLQSAARKRARRYSTATMTEAYEAVYDQLADTPACTSSLRLPDPIGASA